jgi:hypothetical protein
VRDGQRHMAPVHRLAVELSDQRGSTQPQQMNGVILKKRSLYHSITAKRFSPTGLIALNL